MKAKHPVTENGLVLRLMKHFDSRGEIMVRRRTRTNLGPIFIVSQEGLVVAKGIPDLETLGRTLDLLKPNEVLV